MRRLLALALAALVALGAALLAPQPAAAGGPTSVLVTDPATGRATALYYSDARYVELEALLGSATSIQAEPPGLGGPPLNVTWMVHDVHPWRVQRVYPAAEGGAVVASSSTDASGRLGDVTWSRVPDTEGLAAVLDRVFRGRGRIAPAEVEVPPAVPATPAVVEREVVRTETEWYSLTSWRWAFPGLVLGVGTALLARRRAADAEPRLVLTDVEPELQPAVEPFRRR